MPLGAPASAVQVLGSSPVCFAFDLTYRWSTPWETTLHTQAPATHSKEHGEFWALALCLASPWWL